MTLFVVIELADSGVSAPYAAEMVAACTASLRQGECVLGAGAPPDPAHRRDRVA